MTASPFDVHQSTAAELQERLRLDEAGRPYVVFRDDERRQRCVVLEPDAQKVSVGRSPEADVAVTWDPLASRLHAFFERTIDGWSIVDDGRALNRTTVNGEAVSGRRRLVDRDIIKVGATELCYREVTGGVGDPTMKAAPEAPTVALSAAQRRVLVAVCRPFGEGRSFAMPASNEEVAAELVVGIDAVKTNMRALFERFGLQDAPRNQKRALLVQRAFESGVISARDYETG
jgi:hypothetical protein